MTNDMTDKINNFLNRFKPNYYIYISVIKRFFKQDYNKVIEYILEHNLVEKEELYRCPYCNISLNLTSENLIDFDDNDMIECYHCEKDFKKCNSSIEPVYKKKG